MVANKYAFLQITRRRFLNEWEAFKKVISRRNIRRRITRSEERFSRNAETDLVCRLRLEKTNAAAARDGRCPRGAGPPWEAQRPGGRRGGRTRGRGARADRG